jgi:undecaprenyl-diphosphatase
MAAYPILTHSAEAGRAVMREFAQNRVTRAILGFGTRTDYGLMRRVNRWRAPKWLRLWMIAATRGGDGWLWYAMGSVVAVFGGRERFTALLAAAVAAAAGIAIFLKLKRLCGRRRPCVIEPHCWATLLPPDQFSFPSGHTITAFAVAVSLGAFYPAALAGLLFCAASVAASRILLGMHFLTDVIAGAMIGTALGVIASTVAASTVG